MPSLICKRVNDRPAGWHADDAGAARRKADSKIQRFGTMALGTAQASAAIAESSGGFAGLFPGAELTAPLFIGISRLLPTLISISAPARPVLIGMGVYAATIPLVEGGSGGAARLRFSESALK